MFRNRICLCSQMRGETPTLLGPLGRANHNHWNQWWMNRLKHIAINFIPSCLRILANTVHQCFPNGVQKNPKVSQENSIIILKNCKFIIVLVVVVNFFKVILNLDILQRQKVHQDLQFVSWYPSRGRTCGKLILEICSNKNKTQKRNKCGASSTIQLSSTNLNIKRICNEKRKTTLGTDTWKYVTY
jgi:hypothetical protein